MVAVNQLDKPQNLKETYFSGNKANLTQDIITRTVFTNNTSCNVTEMILESFA